MDATIQLTGNVGSDVDYRNNTAPVASFRLAHTPRERHGTEWSDGPTTWLTVKAFYALAEHLAVSVKKGDPVVVVGKLRTVTWEKDGVAQSRIELVAETVGHDLRRGAARFTRAVRAGSGEDGDATGPAGEQPEQPGSEASIRAA